MEQSGSLLLQRHTRNGSDDIEFAIDSLSKYFSSLLLMSSEQLSILPPYKTVSSYCCIVCSSEGYNYNIQTVIGTRDEYSPEATDTVIRKLSRARRMIRSNKAPVGLLFIICATVVRSVFYPYCTSILIQHGLK